MERQFVSADQTIDWAIEDKAIEDKAIEDRAIDR